MTQTLTQPADLGAVMLERAGIIMQLNARHLALDWLREFDIPCLHTCCKRVEESLPDETIVSKDVQRELIRNPAFAAWFAQLLALFPKEPPAEPEPAMSYRRNYAPTARPKEPSCRAVLAGRLIGLLRACQANGRDITAYPQKDLLSALEDERLNSAGLLVYMENFAPMALAEETRQAAVCGIQHCTALPVMLSEPQRALLTEAFVPTRHLFAAASFSAIWESLTAHPALLDIARLLHSREIQETLGLEHYQSMAPNAAEHHALLSSIIDRMDAAAASLFIAFWQRGGCSLQELKRMERQFMAHPSQNWDAIFATYSGYVNLLYGVRYKSIDLSAVNRAQENILIYAIVHNKKHFIRLVDEHSETFLGLPSASILFDEKLYTKHLNLNELTEKDLGDCRRMYQKKFNIYRLAPGRRYTFPELRALYDSPGPYITLYHLLESDSQDYRLKVLSQLRKRDVLSGMEESDLSALAARLSTKPLYDWMQADFAHIAGLTTQDAARLLSHLDALRRILPEIQNRTDALLVLRNLDVLEQFNSISALRENLLEIDGDWCALSQRMELKPEFLAQHRDSIVRFVCGNGAYIAETYRRHLSTSQEEAFLRVVKAELMGQLGTLKYFEGDLQTELDAPLTNHVKSRWKVNLNTADGSLEVRECDDFFATMLLGVQPHRTCLSYVDGAYRECLLSAFDSNKKILYATMDGQIVGRAFLRLTKGRLTCSDAGDSSHHNDFTFVDLENAEAVRRERPGEKERVTLFLERPYISGVGPETRRRIMRMFIVLASQKADDLDTLLVLSQDYKDDAANGFTRTRFSLYISKSKAGSQYLDSLGGQAAVSAEGSYKANTFLVREQNTTL